MTQTSTPSSNSSIPPPPIPPEPAGATLISDVLRNLGTLGEAAKHVPVDVKARRPAVAWREIAGMRDWLAQGDLTIEADIVWNAIEVELPLLLRTLQNFKDEGQS